MGKSKPIHTRSEFLGAFFFFFILTNCILGGAAFLISRDAFLLLDSLTFRIPMTAVSAFIAARIALKIVANEDHRSKRDGARTVEPAAPEDH